MEFFHDRVIRSSVNGTRPCPLRRREAILTSGQFEKTEPDRPITLHAVATTRSVGSESCNILPCRCHVAPNKSVLFDERSALLSPAYRPGCFKRADNFMPQLLTHKGAI